MIVKPGNDPTEFGRGVSTFLSKEQAVAFAPAIEKTYWRKHREDNDRWLVERTRAR